MKRTRFVAMALVAGLGCQAFGSITVTQGASAPTYGTTLNFDEPGGPTGSTALDAWQASHGITEMQAGDGAPFVGDFTTGPEPWIGTGNSFFGNFGVFIKFDSNLTEMSLEVWDPAGDPSPFGGGMVIYLFDDGVEVANYSGTPAWGGLGDTWIDVTTSAGMVFDEIRVLGFGFPNTTYVDNLSWNVVPEPTSLLLFGLGGLALLRRR